MISAPRQRTPLHARHVAAGARLVPFAGFEMPLCYGGIVAEHRAVRSSAGLFDVSHMGEFSVRGPDALEGVNRLVCNDVRRLTAGQGLYSPMCYANGGVVDDCLVYRRRSGFLLVVNAANRSKDFQWCEEQLSGLDCTLEDISDQMALIALQGPRAAQILASTSEAGVIGVPPFHTIEASVAGATCLLSRTGYTGEDGFEIYCDNAEAVAIWDTLRAAGEPLGLALCGLGARDTLRLEARLPLYGQELTADSTPLEAGLGWTVKLDKPDFIGKQALIDQKRAGLQRRLVGLLMTSRGIARTGHIVYPEGVRAPLEPSADRAIGSITSGTMSPTLGKAIALAYVKRKWASKDSRVEIDVRGRTVSAQVVRGPFYRAPTQSD